MAVHAFMNRHTALILTYHSVIDHPTVFDLWTHISLHRFEEHMQFLKQSARVISLTEMADAIQRQCLPTHAVAITFDDGFANNYTRAFPVLRRLGLPATIFLSTGFIGGRKLFWPERLAYQLMLTDKDSISVLGETLWLRNKQDRRHACTVMRENLKKLHPDRLDETLADIESMLNVPLNPEEALLREWLPLNWEQVREMADSGLIDFGGHTHSHGILAKMDDFDAQRQITDCRTALRDNLDRPVTLWAYPNGTMADFNPVHRSMLETHGFKTIVTAMPQFITTESDPAELGRWSIGNDNSVRDLYAILSKRNRWSTLTPIERQKTIIMALIGRHGRWKNPTSAV